MRRIYKYTSLIVSALVLAYLRLLYFPQPMFAYSSEYSGFKVYTRDQPRHELNAVLDSAEERLRVEDLFTQQLAEKEVSSRTFANLET